MADDVIIQAQNTAFERNSTSRMFKGYTMPTTLFNNIVSNYINTAPSTTLSIAEQNYLLKLLTNEVECLPGGLTLRNIMLLVPELFNGAGELQAIFQKDPFSTDYENSTKALYERQYDKARAAAISGPANVRGATARQGVELAEIATEMANNRFREIWQNQLALAQIVEQAIQVFNAIEEARRRSQLQAQQQQAATEQGRVVQGLAAAEQLSRLRNDHTRAVAAGGEFVSLPNMTVLENAFGIGSQASVQTAFGASYWR